MYITFNNKYKSEARIGIGYSGIIYKVLEIATKKNYALKFFPIVKNNENNENDNFQGFDKETIILKNIKNKYIIELKDKFFDQKQKGYCIVVIAI